MCQGKTLKNRWDACESNQPSPSSFKETRQNCISITKNVFMHGFSLGKPCTCTVFWPHMEYLLSVCRLDFCLATTVHAMGQDVLRQFEAQCGLPTCSAGKRRQRDQSHIATCDAATGELALSQSVYCSGCCADPCTHSVQDLNRLTCLLLWLQVRCQGLMVSHGWMLVIFFIIRPCVPAFALFVFS